MPGSNGLPGACRMTNQVGTGVQMGTASGVRQDATAQMEREKEYLSEELILLKKFRNN